MEVGIVEVVCCVAEGVDFQFGEQVLGHFLQEPVDDHAAFDAALGMQDENHFCEVWLIKLGLDDGVARTDVVGCVGEVALDEALKNVEKDAIAMDCVSSDLDDRKETCGKFGWK